MGRFNLPSRPNGWEHHWTKYPEGYTILEALIEWLGHVDKMTDNINNWNDYLDNFVAEFDMNVRDGVTALVEQWMSDGTMSAIINEELFRAYTDEKLKPLFGLTDDYVYIYTDSVSGSDTTGDGSPAKPYKTLQFAADSVPKVINKDHYIHPVGTFNEDVVFKGIIGAGIIITPADGIVDASAQNTAYMVKSINFYDCNALCRVDNPTQYNAVNIAGAAFIRFSRCAYGTAHALRCNDSNITVNTVEFDGSRGSVNSCYFNGQEYCIVAKNGASVRVDSTNKHGGTPSSTGIYSDAAQVYLNGDVSFVESTSNAIAQGKGGEINYTPIQKELGQLLTNGWLAYDTGKNAPIAIKRNGVVELAGLIKSGTVGQGVVAFQLPPLWRPQFKDRFYHPFGSDGNATKIRIGTEGNVSVEVSTGQYISLSDIPPFYVGE